ncbi:MAG: SCO2322 family protein, partial [Carbonactinosporaceae bacterium]
MPTDAGSPSPDSTGGGTTYRYWSFWQWKGSDQAGKWAFAKVGPGQSRPADGAVQGWRFTESGANESGTAPRSPGDFSRICGDTPSRGDAKRVGVVIDYGTAADAPAGQRPPQPRERCVQVQPEATAADVLAEITPLRYDQDRLICSLGG